MNIIPNGMSLKMECHSNEVSLKLEFHSKWIGTQNGMSLKLECHINWYFTQIVCFISIGICATILCMLNSIYIIIKNLNMDL